MATIPNKTSKYVWQYQAAHGTAYLTTAAGVGSSESFEFGEYNDECGKWDNPYVENNVIPSWVYSSRTPTLTNVATKYPIFKHTFLPVTMQYQHWILGTTADGTPTTVTCTALAEGRHYPLTIRHQEDGGTRPNNAQAVDCHCVKIRTKAERGINKSLIVTTEFAFGALEDISDNVNLTRDPTAAGGCTNSFNGNPIVTWDTGGDNNAIPEITLAEWIQEKEYTIETSDEGTIQKVYTDKLKPVTVILGAVLQTLDPSVEGLWKDYMDRKISANMTIQVRKHGSTGATNLYATFTFTDCRINTVIKTGDRNKGHYGCIAVMTAAKVEVVSDWYTDNGGAPTFLTHWKTVALA